MDSSAAPLAADSAPETAAAESVRTPHSEIRQSKHSGQTIHILSAAVTSRIAAGEVVERPASVVKELVENALDAGASDIRVELSAGGKKRIRVSDNGRGMQRADLALCCLPHATSKLQSADELESLSTLGFRGEALPSIAAVSHFSLTTRQRADDSAWTIQIDGGEPEAPQPKPASGAAGTSAEVRELFYNLPARAKFLKGDAAEAAACADTLLRLALTRPDVAFTLFQERHELFALPACCAPQSDPAAPGLTAPALPVAAFQRRAREVLGRSNSAGLIELAVEGPGETSRKSRVQSPESTVARLQTPDAGLSDSFTGYRLYGLVSPPAVTRPNRSQIYLTVNGRAVKDRLLTSALLESYRHLLPPKRYPAAVLFLEVPGPDVDINVHPTKAEVRFRLQGLVYALLHHAIRSACGVQGAEGGRPKAESSETSAPPRPPLGAPQIEPGQTTFDLWNGERSAPNCGLENQPPVAAPRSYSNSPAIDAAHSVAEAPRPYVSSAPSTLSRPSTPPFNPQPEIRNPQSARVAPSPLLPLTPTPPPVPAPPAPFRVLGQAGGAYIVLEDDSGVKLIDQHALHERILFEELLARAQGRSRGDCQGLLIAETLELSPVQAALFAQDDSAAQVLLDIGFDVEPFGPRAVAVRGVPAILKANAAPLVKDVLDALAQSADETPGARSPATRAGLREKAAYVLSCKGAIKAGERLTVDQMSALLIEFRKKVGRGGFTCPHGRPLAVELSWEDLERGVGRR